MTFVMSFEAAIPSVGGDDTTMAKIFVIVITGIAWTWYTTMDPGRMFSWDQINGALLEKFQDIYDDPVTASHLFAIKHRAMESLRSNIRRFVHIRCQAVGLSDDSIINAAKQGLRPSPLRRKLTRTRPESVLELMWKLEQYARAEDDELRGAQEEVGSGDPGHQKPEARPSDHRPERGRDREDWTPPPPPGRPPRRCRMWSPPVPAPTTEKTVSGVALTNPDGIKTTAIGKPNGRTRPVGTTHARTASFMSIMAVTTPATAPPSTTAWKSLKPKRPPLNAPCSMPPQYSGRHRHTSQPGSCPSHTKLHRQSPRHRFRSNILRQRNLPKSRRRSPPPTTSNT